MQDANNLIYTLVLFLYMLHCEIKVNYQGWVKICIWIQKFREFVFEKKSQKGMYVC